MNVKIRAALTTLLELAGAALIVYAAWLMFPPIGIALAGVALIGVSFLMVKTPGGRA